MIIELILIPLFSLVRGIINLLPNNPGVNLTLANLILFLKKGLYFTDSFVFFTLISTVVFWTSVQFTWAIVEWVYKKIPGIK